MSVAIEVGLYSLSMSYKDQLPGKYNSQQNNHVKSKQQLLMLLLKAKWGVLLYTAFSYVSKTAPKKKSHQDLASIFD